MSYKVLERAEYQRETDLSASIFRRRLVSLAPVTRGGERESERETRGLQDRFRFITTYLRCASIHANLSICLQPFRRNRSASFWLSSASFMPRSLGDAIRRGVKKKYEATGGVTL